MKKIVVVSFFAIATMIGCASPSEQLCIESATCAEEDDPAQFCADAKEDLDEDAAACQETCKAENDALASCCLENGACDEVGEAKIFCAEAFADQCEDQAKAAGDCAADC